MVVTARDVVKGERVLSTIVIADGAGDWGIGRESCGESSCDECTSCFRERRSGRGVSGGEKERDGAVVEDECSEDGVRKSRRDFEPRFHELDCFLTIDFFSEETPRSKSGWCWTSVELHRGDDAEVSVASASGGPEEVGV